MLDEDGVEATAPGRPLDRPGLRKWGARLRVPAARDCLRAAQLRAGAHRESTSARFNRMLFNSLHFVIFFLVVWGLVALLRKHVVARNVMLLVAGYYFYAWWDWRFLSLLWLTTLFDYFCGRMLRVENHVPGQPLVRPRRDRMFLAASMALNLTILGFFKYFNFFVTSTATLLSNLGVHPHVTTLQIILPLGISFYTFQSMNYVIDVYRGELEGEKSLLNFALFVSFFPHLVAGPILRATALMRLRVFAGSGR